MKAPPLKKLADRYLAERNVSAIYAKNMLRTAERCHTLSADSVNAYLKRRLSAVQASTVKSERTILLSIWRHAYEHEWVELPPRGIMRFKVAKRPTEAWTQEQMRHSLAVARQTPGHLKSGAAIADYLECWIRLGYESGARHGDLRSFRVEQVRGDVIRWTQSKTGDPIEKVLTAECVAAITKLAAKSTDGTIMGWCCGVRMAHEHMKAHVARCGIGGTSKWLRRAGATHIEMLYPGKARLHLGHRSVGLAERNYLDWGQIRKTTPQTPSLEQ